MICEKHKINNDEVKCIECYVENYLSDKKDGSVNVKKEDLLFLIEQTRLEENYIEHEKISNIRKKYLGEKGN